MSITAQDIKIAPAHAPGKGVAEALKHGVYMAKSETIHPSSDTTPQEVFKVPHNVFIHDLVLEVGTSYNGNYILAGIAADTDCLISDTTAALPGTTYSMKNGNNAAIYKGGYNCSSDQVVALQYDGSTGTITAYLFFSAYSNENFVEP